MKASVPKPRNGLSPRDELAKVSAQLTSAQEALRAILGGEVDSVVVAGKGGSQVFTLEGAEPVYRMLIESMNEGALTLSSQKLILYANQCFARMVRSPLEQVIGTSFRQYLNPADRATLLQLMSKANTSGSKFQAMLNAADQSRTPVQISIRKLTTQDTGASVIGMVITDMTEARQNEQVLRTLTHRVVQAQEAERGRVAAELHDRITQPLCGLLVRSQNLADSMATHDGSARREAVTLRVLIGQTAEQVESISRNLRPGVLAELGLVTMVRSTGREFALRTGVRLRCSCWTRTDRLPGDIELTLFRILQGALQNVERHARARQVWVRLARKGAVVRLTIRDDGIGFDPARRHKGRPDPVGVGLLGMRERASYVGGTLTMTSKPRVGTNIEVVVPVRPPSSGTGPSP